MSDKPHLAAVDINGNWYLHDAKGALVPIATVKPVDLLMDEVVRAMLAEAAELSAAIAVLKRRSFERVGEFQALIAQQYGAKIGGAKGNVTLSTFDGCMKVQVQISDQLEFGAELQAAKVLVDDVAPAPRARRPATASSRSSSAVRSRRATCWRCVSCQRTSPAA